MNASEQDDFEPVRLFLVEIEPLLCIRPVSGCLVLEQCIAYAPEQNIVKTHYACVPEQNF